MTLPTDAEPAVSVVSSLVPSTAEELVRDFYSHVRRFALSLLDDPDDAEDATQEALIAAVGSLAKFRGESSFKTWLYGITLNVCRNHLRKMRVRRTVGLALQTVHFTADTQPSPEESASMRESDRELWGAVDHLDDNHRVTVIMRYVHNLPVREIAAAMKTSEGTVHSRLHYARQSLRKKLSKSRPEREARQ